MEVQLLTKFSTVCLFLTVSFIYLNVADSQKIGTQGQSITLTCHFDAEGDVRVQWLDPRNQQISYDSDVTNGQPDRYKIESPYRNERNLKIVSVHSDDAGTYKCRYSVPADGTVREKVVNLVVNVPPVILNKSEDQTVETGSDVSLQCYAGGNPLPVISWFRILGDGSRVSVNVEGNIYRITAIDRQSAGEYMCSANNDVKPTATEKMRVDILFGPDAIIPYREVSQHEGSMAMMSCLVIANPVGNIYWQHNGERLINSTKYRITDATVGEYQQMLRATITQLEASDFGIYECIAENQFGQDTDRLTIYEYQSGRIRVLATPKDTISLVNSQVVLDCSVDGISARESITWWYTGNSEQYQRLFVSNSPESLNADRYEINSQYNLIIKSVSFSDAGDYICEISGHRNYSAELTVLDRVVCVDKMLTADDDEKVFSECMLSHTGPSNAGWHVDWIRSDTGDKLPSMKQDGAGLVKRILTLQVAYPSSAGEYVCSVTSRRPFYVDNCTLQLVVRPDKAGNVSASCNGHQSSKPVNDSSQTILLLSLFLTVVIISSTVLFAVLVTHYRRRIASLPREPVEIEAEALALKKSNGQSSPVTV